MDTYYFHNHIAFIVTIMKEFVYERVWSGPTLEDDRKDLFDDTGHVSQNPRDEKGPVN